MKTITEKQITKITEQAKLKGSEDFDFMFNEDERGDEEWIIDTAEIDIPEQSEQLYWILEDSKTGITKDEAYELGLIGTIKQAYVEGWNKRAEEVLK